jgi:hypothetical protein
MICCPISWLTDWKRQNGCDDFATDVALMVGQGSFLDCSCLGEGKSHFDCSSGSIL